MCSAAARQCELRGSLSQSSGALQLPLGSDALRFFAPTLGSNPTPEQAKRPLISSMPSLWSKRASWRSRERRQMWRGARAGMGHDSAVVRILSLRRAVALDAQHSVQQTGGMACQQRAGSVVGARWERQTGRRRLARHPQPKVTLTARQLWVRVVASHLPQIRRRSGQTGTQCVRSPCCATQSPKSA